MVGCRSTADHHGCLLAGVGYEVEMDVLMGDSRRGCLHHLDDVSSTDCRSHSSAILMFPDNVLERGSVEAHWLAVFPVRGATENILYRKLTPN